MASSLLMDVHIPKSITDGVRRSGVDVVTAQDENAGLETDENLLRRAVELNRLLYSQDADFLEIATLWQADGKTFPGIIYGSQLGCSIGRTIEDLELICKCATPSELESRVIFLPLS